MAWENLEETAQYGGGIWKGTTWYGEVPVVHHGMTYTCGGACYGRDAWGCTIRSADVWGVPRFEKCLYGSMIKTLCWGTAWYWGVCDMGDRGVCGYLGGQYGKVFKKSPNLNIKHS